MKYGILTFQNAPNYGAALQAFALGSFLRSNGIDCEIIDYQCDSINEKERCIAINGGIFTKINYLMFHHKKIKLKIEGHDAFMRQSGLLSRRTYNRKNISSANNEYDAFITGSDQVWNTKLTNSDFSYFLDFASENKKRISYAASAAEEWSQEESIEIGTLLGRYSQLYLREESLTSYLQEHFNLNAYTVADPTMLLTPDDYKKMALRPKESSYVLVYYPTSRLLEKAKKYAEKKGLSVVVISSGMSRKEYIKVLPKDPYEWLGYILYADAVFTSSYHGLLFSLYFKKSVWGEYDRKRGSRWESIINKLGIKECIVDSENENLNSVNYNVCEAEMNAFRDESRRKLLYAIESDK